MVFLGEPNLYVNEQKVMPFTRKKSLKVLCVFDGNGRYETQDERIIAKMKPNFKHVDNGILPLKVVDRGNQIITCNICGHTFNNKGFAMAHFRKEHKRGDL